MTRKPFEWINETSKLFLENGYLLPGQTPEERIKQICDTAEKILKKEGFSEKMYDYMSKGWISLATPIWTNFGTHKGLPISCFGSYIKDDMASILSTHAEVGMLTKWGGGTSGYFGELRPRGSKIGDNGTSNGSVHFMQFFDKVIDIVSQGSVRRGTFAGYLPIEHPDIDEFLDIATEGNPIQKIFSAVTVTDEWLQSMVDGDEKKRAIWAKVIQRRGEVGYPYIMFIDNTNNQRPQVYKDKDKKIYASNVCSEIALPSNEDWTFVCCLSSVNVLWYDEWKDTDLVETMVYFLDAVMSEFISKLEAMRDGDNVDKQQSFEMVKKTYNFARENRALGIGVLGWQSYLQSKMLAFESEEAGKLNAQVFKIMREQADRASEKMAKEYGEPELLKGYGRRHTTTLAVAPTTSSSFILGQVSQGIEPAFSNCFVKDREKLKVVIKNQLLEKLLEEKGKNTKEVWESIRNNDGSVQHLDFLSDNEKAVFRTFAEIDQYSIIEQAAVRQVFIDQAQSLNIMISSSTSVKDINNLYLTAWRKGIKTLYYQHSMNAAQELARKKICESCEA